MKVVIQRVSEASVTIEESCVAEIKQGLLILLGITQDDTNKDVDWLVTKIINLRIFSDERHVMNLSVKDVGGELIVVSQFTLHASTKKGNRPSYINAAKPETAILIYKKFVDALQLAFGKHIQTGQFGADMKISLINDGPVTIVIDSKNKF